MSNILVTGGAGFIGSNFVEYLINKGKSVIIIDKLTYAGNLSNLKNLEARNFYTFIEGDIGDPNLLKSIFKTFDIKWVVNFAGESHVEASSNDPSRFIQTNIVGVYNLLEQSLKYYKELALFAQAEFRFLQISTDEVFGSIDIGSFNEESPMRPNSPYSASKAAANMLIRSWHNTYKLPTLITHSSNNFGPKQHPEKLIPGTVLKAISGQPITIHGAGENIRDWMYVLDHCVGIEKALLYGIPGEEYCLGSNIEMSNINLANLICNQLDKIKPRADGESYFKQITYVKNRLINDFRYSLNTDKAKKRFGFRPIRESFERDLYNTIRWYVNNPNWYKEYSEEK